MNEKFVRFNQGMPSDYLNEVGDLPEYLAEILLAISIHNPGGYAHGNILDAIRDNHYSALLDSVTEIFERIIEIRGDLNRLHP